MCTGSRVTGQGLCQASGLGAGVQDAGPIKENAEAASLSGRGGGHLLCKCPGSLTGGRMRRGADADGRRSEGSLCSLSPDGCRSLSDVGSGVVSDSRDKRRIEQGGESVK